MNIQRKQQNKSRKILIITGSRGEYGYIKPVIKMMDSSPFLDYEILATNMHLLPEFGNSIKEFDNDSINVDHKVYMALSGYTTTTMVKSLGVFTLSIADILSNNPPDIILLAGDRGEQLVAAMAGAHMNIPVAHIQAGERSGNVDGMSRHAIARFAHIHFAANTDAEQRLIKTGEEAFRVFRVGAPQLDELTPVNIVPPQEIAKEFSLDLDQPILLVVQHPVTEQAAFSGVQMEETMKAVTVSGFQNVIIYPNNDAGSVSIQKFITKNRCSKTRVVRNLPRETYIGLMKNSSVIVGNSSSGLLEAPSFELPAVNIGRRQAGRLQGENVINVPEHDSSLILKGIKKALSQEFRFSLKGISNPYGDGKASERIINILETIPIDNQLVFKRITY